MFSFERMIKVWDKYSSMYWSGLGYTLLFALAAVVVGMILGLVIASGRMMKSQSRDNEAVKWLKGVVRAVCTAYVEVFRATPMLVQVFIIYYSIGMVLKLPDSSFNRMFWGMVAVGLNSAAYMSEVIRSGIGAVPGGQMEAARCVGMSHWQAMQHVILPQAVRNILPAMCNEFVTIIKESSICYTIGVQEIMYAVSATKGATYRIAEPLVVATVVYFCLTFPTSKIIAYCERRMRRGDKR